MSYGPSTTALYQGGSTLAPAARACSCVPSREPPSEMITSTRASRRAERTTSSIVPASLNVGITMDRRLSPSRASAAGKGGQGGGGGPRAPRSRCQAATRP